ncbi:hypothetical protein HPB52_003957 [Rhipicephalus sanguineus]|uniref:Pre-mRNA-splicing factor 38 n=1 Tax=Rhipicephalus sanguineus TaxID=34632 RepID=A0A9D4PBA0_RHISA|nr:hypothetical protein HPB52_003957 [Rhipicephalus sanguineus]
MANRTVKDAHSVRGTNPQYLVEKIIRSRIYDSRYWKEECFALTAELLVDKAMELRYIGGVYGGNVKPAPFLCLLLKMLQIQPEKDIVVEFIRQDEFNSLDCYKYLEPLYNDYRKLRRQNRDGVNNNDIIAKVLDAEGDSGKDPGDSSKHPSLMLKDSVDVLAVLEAICMGSPEMYVIVHMDEFIDELLREERVADIILPRIQKRQVLEESGELEPRVSALEDDLDDVDSGEDEIEDVPKELVV